MNSTSDANIKNTKELSYDFDSVKRIPLYFGSKEKPLLAWLHITDSEQHSNTGVVICPPLAVEYMNSYRSLRYTADYFALAGIPALRFDYHGTGDSSGIEEDDDRLKEWLANIHSAIEKLKDLTGCNNLGLFGFRMGATLAALVSEKTSIDFLILWAALISGKKYIREIKLLQMTSKFQVDNNALLEAGGMAYWEQTVRDISKVNLKNVTPRANRTLIIPRDEQTSDNELSDAWTDNGVNIEQQYHLGSTLMLVDAHQTVVPHQSIQSIIQWVKKDIDVGSITSNVKSLSNTDKTTTNIPYTSALQNSEQPLNADVKETIVYFGSDNRNVAILTEPTETPNTNLPTIIIANSGANHRVGPSRLYVLIARELSRLGYRSIRIDVPGIGDSITSNQNLENIEYITSSSKKISDVIVKLNSDSYRKEYILMGLCSGAYFSFHAALQLNHANIKESILINPLTFYWDKGMTAENALTKEFSIWNWYKEAITTRNSWIKLFKGKIDFTSLFHAITNRLQLKATSKLNQFRSKKTHTDKHKYQLALDLQAIAEKNIHIQFILSRNDPGYDILMTNAGRTAKKLLKSNKISINFIENADHTFSKYTPRTDVLNTITKHFIELKKTQY